MSDWRTMMGNSFSLRQIAQNTQINPSADQFEHFEDIAVEAKKPNPPKAVIEPAPLAPHWLAEYRRLYALVGDLHPDDPRYALVHQALDDCDRAFALRDMAAFNASVNHVEKIMAEPSPPARQATPEPPLKAGWSVAYKDRQGRLRGGSDEREAGTVAACERTGSSWLVTLTNGDRLPLAKIVGVVRTDAQGRIVAAWTTREHGFDGERGAR